MNVPSLLLKIVVCTHFFLSVWGSMSLLFMPLSYTYVHIGVFLCGLWAIGVPRSTEAVVMMLVTLGFSILQDIILLGLYEPRGYYRYETGNATASELNEYRFALGMCILNLILKPFSAFILFRLYMSRSNDTAFTIPGMERIPGLGGMASGGYENLDDGRSPQYSGMPVESASHHSTITKE